MERVAVASLVAALPGLSGAPSPEPVKILVSVDMEGIAGLTHEDQVSAAGPDFAIGRKFMTAEANAAVEGAFEGGATEVWVVDAHGGQRNLLLEELDPRVSTIVTGRPKPFGMMEGIDASFAGAVFVGYHPRAGTTDGVLDHTWSSREIAGVSVNGKEFGEAGLNAALAGEFGVPVLCITGDKAAVEEARALLGPIETVAVKEGIGRTAARTTHPLAAREAIRAGVKRAVERRAEFRPYKVAGPVELGVRFFYSDQADAAAGIPGVRRVGPTEVACTGATFLDAWRFFRAF